LDFSAHYHQSLIFLNEIRWELLHGRTHNVLIDVRQLVEISAPAAIVLLAELSRCTAYTQRQKSVRGNYPASDRAKQMLRDVGFFAAFQVKAPDITSPTKDRVYVRTASGNQSDGRYTRPFLSLFERVAALTPLASKRLYSALIECMDNVKAHAYDPSIIGDPNLVDEWWLGGFADPVRRRLALVFYDTGHGIPRTIKQRRMLRVANYARISDARILERAVNVGFTRTRDNRRGNGLPSLKDFIDLAPGGFLRVASGSGDLTYRRQSKLSAKRLPVPMTGSLIIWTIEEQPSLEWDGAGDLIEAGEQISLRF